MFKKRISILPFSIVILSSCTMGPNYVRPPDYLPGAYTEEKPENEENPDNDQQFVSYCDLPSRWWEFFQSDALNELVEASLIQNPNVVAAQAALRLAMENLYAEKGFLYPTITGSFTPTRQKSSESLAPIVNSNAFYYCLYTAQVSVTYTADVFGGIRRQIESLKAQADSQSFTLQATYLTLTANVVNAAIQEAGLRGQIATTKKIIALQSQLLSTYKQLLDLGQVSVADVTLIEASLASAEANLAPLEKQLAIQRDLLHTLVGRFPSDTLTAKFELDSLQLPTELPLALPSSLVEHRPDVRAAEELLHAASAAIGVAIANRLPNITLSPDYGWASTSFRELLDPKNVFWDLAGSLMEPIFDGGTLKHKELAAWASYDQAAAQYRATVLNAFQNVADSLEAIQADAKAYQAAKKAESAASKTLEISRGQLEAGDTSILLLLTIEQAYHQAALNVVQAQTNRLSDTAALFQSLGGTWWN